MSDKTTYALLKTSYYTTWFEDGDTVDPADVRGFDPAGHWLNHAGGRMPKHASQEVLETCEATCFQELDYTKTDIRDDSSDAGWISPDGEWFGCGREAHNDFAYFYLKMGLADLRAGGWIHVYNAPGKSGMDWSVENDRGGPTEQQRKTLTRMGYAIDDVGQAADIRPPEDTKRGKKERRRFAIGTAVHEDYADVKGKLYYTSALYGYKDDDYVELLGLDPPLLVRIRTDMDKTDLERWADSWCSPYWDVEFVCDRPELRGVESAWVVGTSYHMDGRIEQTCLEPARDATWPPETPQNVAETKTPPTPPPEPEAPPERKPAREWMRHEGDGRWRPLVTLDKATLYSSTLKEPGGGTSGRTGFRMSIVDYEVDGFHGVLGGGVGSTKIFLTVTRESDGVHAEFALDARDIVQDVLDILRENPALLNVAAEGYDPDD